MLRFIGLVAMLGWAASANAAASGPWQASAPFRISPTKDRCIAVGDFTRGDEKLLIALEARPTASDYSMRLYMAGTLRHWDEGKYSFAGLKPEYDAVSARPSEQGRMIILRLGTNRSDLNAAGPNPRLKISQVVNPGEITIAGLGAAVSLLDACSANLLEHWGYSKERQSKIAIPAKIKESWASYVSSFDYPMKALFSRAGGESHILVDVGTDGRGSNCRVIVHSNNEEIDQTTCKVATERARYVPAQDVNGQPIAAPTYLVFRWEMPSPPWY